MSEDPSEKAATTLAQIADLLECPVDVFTQGADGAGALRDVSELLRLWQAIPQEADRRRLLELARHLAGH